MSYLCTCGPSLLRMQKLLKELVVMNKQDSQLWNSYRFNEVDYLDDVLSMINDPNISVTGRSQLLKLVRGMMVEHMDIRELGKIAEFLIHGSVKLQRNKLSEDDQLQTVNSENA